MKTIYISGPFSHPDPVHGIPRNILAASEAALRCCRAGWAVVCPHKNTADFQHVQDIPYDFWIQMDLELLARSDAALFLPGWVNSPGAGREWKYAQELKIPSFYECNGIPDPAVVAERRVV